MQPATQPSRNMERAMRALASMVLTAITVIAMPSGAQADASSEQRVCLDNASTKEQRIAACSFVIRNAPPVEARELARLYFVRGNAHLSLGAYDRALLDFDAAIMGDPNAHGPFNSRGLVFRRQKQFDRAIVEFDESIRRNPKDTVPLINRGDTYRDQGRLDRALQDYDGAIAINPKSVNAYFGRALTLQQKASSDFEGFLNEGRFEELAIAEYGKVLQISPRSANALNNRGRLYHTLRRYDLAMADFTQAIEINPADPVFLRNRALTYRMLRQFDLAIADYRKALTTTQDDAGRQLIVQLLAQLGIVV
jgi:tetratricopeptide (TPR) repeat protein